MAVTATHPLYSQFIQDWQLLRDAYEGQRKVKSKREVYLPATPGQVEDGLSEGQKGRKNYDAYLTRALFPEVLSDAIETILGVMHQKPPTIELPAQLEQMREDATTQGESLELLLRRINEQQLITGRLGLLLDVENNTPVGTMPYIALYIGEHVRNWDDGRRDQLVRQRLNIVVLDESEYERTSDLDWEFENKYRVLVLGNVRENEPEGVYQVGLFRDEASIINEAELVTPVLNGRTFNRIPFVFINSKDVVTQPDKPPLIGLGRLAMAIYRGDADYRQTLFVQGQDTLVTIGLVADEDDELRVGMGARIDLPIGGDAKYIGTDSSGLPELRTSIENDKSEAQNKGGRLLNEFGRQAESGEALNTRVSVKTASIHQVALAGAFGLQRLLRMAAEWVGANPDEVVVTPNLDFTPLEASGRDLIDIQAAKNMGAPMSEQSIHQWMRDRDLTGLTFEEEMALIEAEEPRLEGTGAGGNPEDDEEGNGNRNGRDNQEDDDPNDDDE